MVQREQSWAARMKLPRVIGRFVVPVALCMALCWALLDRIAGHVPGGPSTTWCLSDGTTVRFYKRSHNPPGRDSIKVLEVARPRETPHAYQFAVFHAGFSFVELRTNREGTLLWVVDAQSRDAGCSLDLGTGCFVDQLGSHPPGVGPETGVVLRPSSWHGVLSAAIIAVVLVLAAAFALRHLQWMVFYPAAGVMPKPVGDDVVSALERFESVLAEYAPEALSSLQPGLSDEQLQDIEGRYQFQLTDEMRALYPWRNGSPPDVHTEFIPGHWFVPLEHAAQLREDDRRQLSSLTLIQRIGYAVFASHRTGWLTVLDGQCGDGYFYDPAPRRRKSSFFCHFAKGRWYWFFPSLANFLAGAIECYEAGIYRSGQRGQSGEDDQRSLAMWSRYAALRVT